MTSGRCDASHSAAPYPSFSAFGKESDCDLVRLLEVFELPLLALGCSTRLAR